MEAVGCALSVREGDWVGVFDVVVAPECRRQGLGRRLMEAAQWGLSRGAKHAYLQVVVGNDAVLHALPGQLSEQIPHGIAHGFPPQLRVERLDRDGKGDIGPPQAKGENLGRGFGRLPVD